MPLQPLTDYLKYIKFMDDESLLNFTYSDLNNRNDSPYFYVITFTESESKKSFVQLFSMFFYQTFFNSLISHDIYDNFLLLKYIGLYLYFVLLPRNIKSHQYKNLLR